MKNLLIPIIFFIIGLLSYHFLLRPKPEVITTVEKHTDTLYVELPKDTVFLTRERINHVFVRDTVVYEFKPFINAYSASYQNQYGNLKVSGEVFGEILTMNFVPDFRFPVVTNTITKKNTLIKKPQGIYLGAGISNFSASVGGVYLNDRNLFQYSYYPQINGHSIGYFRKVF